MTNWVILTNYINSDSNLLIEDQETNEKIIPGVQKTSESVVFKDDDMALDYKEFVSS